MKLITVLLVLAAIMAGCATATVGADFDGSKLPALQPGVTTFEQAVVLLGRKPNTTTAGQSGALGHQWVYVRSDAAAGSVTTQTKSAMLVFNVDGTFQRLLSVQGIDLAQQDRQRLFAAAARP